MKSLADIIASLQREFPGATGAPVEFRGETTIRIAREHLRGVCAWLQTVASFEMLTDLAGVDHYDEEPRFAVDYLLYSLTRHQYLRLEVRLPAADPVVDSVTSVWAAANWHERETFDMYGIRFAGHPDLRRILMWDGYPHHPLRKDFPLAGLPADLPGSAVDAGRAEAAPTHGGPFVPGTGSNESLAREPRSCDTLAEQSQRQAHPDRQEPV